MHMNIPLICFYSYNLIIARGVLPVSRYKYDLQQLDPKIGWNNIHQYIIVHQI